MKVLVTGGAGFIGRNLLPVVAGAGHEVCALARTAPTEPLAGVRWIETDMALPNWTAALGDERADAIIHLAQSRRYREFPAGARDIVDVNVRSTVELAAWALEHGVKRILFASTGNVYGMQDRVYREDDPCDPGSMYAASKLAAEILLKSYASLMDVAVLRLFGVYGPGQTNAMLPGLIDRFVSGAEISLAGNEGVRFNPIHVEDCARVLCHLLSEPALRGFNALNVGGSEVVSLRDAVDIFEAQTGRQARVRVTDEAPKHLVGSTEKLDRMGGGGRRVSFRDGLIGMMSRQLARN